MHRLLWKKLWPVEDHQFSGKSTQNLSTFWSKSWKCVQLGSQLKSVKLLCKFFHTLRMLLRHRKFTQTHMNMFFMHTFFYFDQLRFWIVTFSILGWSTLPNPRSSDQSYPQFEDPNQKCVRHLCNFFHMLKMLPRSRKFTRTCIHIFFMHSFFYFD